AAHSHLDMNGFVVRVEKANIEYPRTPTLIGKRGHSKLFVEVIDKFDRAVALMWIRYGQSCDTDVQFAIALPDNPGPSQGDIMFATANKVGILIVAESGTPTEVVQPVDLALRVNLPDLASLPKAVRRVAAPFYSKFN